MTDDNVWINDSALWGSRVSGCAPLVAAGKPRGPPDSTSAHSTHTPLAWGSGKEGSGAHCLRIAFLPPTSSPFWSSHWADRGARRLARHAPGTPQPGAQGAGRAERLAASLANFNAYDEPGIAGAVIAVLSRKTF